MIRRLAALLFIAFLFLPGCKEDKPKVELTPVEKELLRAKADEKIGIIITENLPALFAGVVVFSSDAFVYQSRMLDQANLSVLNMFGNTAILLLNSPDIPPLLKERSVKKIFYLCRQGALVRLDTPFELDMMRGFGEGKEDEPVAFLIRFREPPDEKDEKLVEAAGFTVQSRTGYVWAVTGPLRHLPRLLESDRISFYESASNGSYRATTTSEPKKSAPTRTGGGEASSSQTGVTVTKEVPSSKETVGEIREREQKEPPPPQEDRAIPFHRIPRGDNNLPSPGPVTDNSLK